jgi:tRNA (guanine6-N2)-methyltransferase
VAVYQVLDFDIPRPKALLGHQNFHRMVDAINTVGMLHPPKSFRSFRFSAAGRDSSVFDRLRDDLAAEIRLVNAPDEADLLLRVCPNVDRSKGWQVLVRLTPRPLATRDWRVCDMPGALNASVAAAMVEMTNPRRNDAFFNPMCGSGTLLIERVGRMPVDLAAGCDTDPDALACGRENVRAAGLGHMIDLLEMDAAALDLPDGAFTALAADLPWGQLSGEHAENPALYRAVLREWARIAARGARLAVVTHEVTVFEDLLGEIADVWALIDVVKVFQGGLHPRIYVFARL